MITCARCAKENQDHYKFCLGCGAKLDAAAGRAKPDKGAPSSMAKGVPSHAAPDPGSGATPAPRDNGVPGPGGAKAGGQRAGTTHADETPPATVVMPAPAVARSASPPIGNAGAQAARSDAAGTVEDDGAKTQEIAAPAPDSGSAAEPARTPSPTGPNPALAARREGHGQAAAAGVLVAPSPARTAGAPARGPAAAAVVISPSASVPMSEAPMPGMVPPPRQDGSAGPGAARDTVVCSKCGKTVGAAYAFCGSCGERLKPTGASAAPAAGSAAIPRTVFMAPSPKVSARGHLTLIRPDGTEGGVHSLQDGENLIGRGQGSLFDADPYLSPRHAEFMLAEDGLTVRDLRSLNGVFIKIAHEEKIESGDIFRIGQELLRFDLIAPPAPLEDGTEIIGTPNPGYWGRISVIVGRDVDGPAFPLFDESIVLGRERGDILFPEDGYVSGTHAQITLRDGQVYLSDLGSSNGTFFRLRGSRVIQAGSLVLMGQQLFRISYR